MQGPLTAEDGVGPDSDACMVAHASALEAWQWQAGGLQRAGSKLITGTIACSLDLVSGAACAHVQLQQTLL